MAGGVWTQGVSAGERLRCARTRSSGQGEERDHTAPQCAAYGKVHVGYTGATAIECGERPGEDLQREQHKRGECQVAFDGIDGLVAYYTYHEGHNEKRADEDHCAVCQLQGHETRGGGARKAGWPRLAR